jgi:hypothetical protein
MDIASSIKQLVEGGLQFDLLFTLFQLLVVAFIVVYLRNVIINEVAYQNFKGNRNIGKMSWIRIGNSTGHENGQIVYFCRKHILVKTEDGIILIPMKRFPEKSWYILSCKPIEPRQNI